MKGKTTIVIVGGGAGGLELATLLGNSLAKKNKINLILVNTTLTYLWKPLLHEVAAGTLNSHEDEVNLVSHGYSHYFHFQLGRMEGLDRTHKKILLSPLLDDAQNIILPRRYVNYDILVIAVGSEANDFNIPGVKEHCRFLNNLEEAENFQKEFLRIFIASQDPRENISQLPLTITIIGGGATGIELSAELHFAAYEAARYGLYLKEIQHIIEINIIETSPTILSHLSKSVIKSTMSELKKRGINIYTDEKVTKVDNNGFYTNRDRFIPSQLKIWAAGIKAPHFLKELGLETNKLNQIYVTSTLQTTLDENIFAIGDCAYCVNPSSHQPVPARAQAAHQQAELLAKSLGRKIKNKSLLEYHYYDYGSLISLSRYQTIGNLLGRFNFQLFISGVLARFAYLFLYRKYQAVLHGWWKVILIAIANFLTSTIRPRLKLH
jgi:NADH dehydrogenase